MKHLECYISTICNCRGVTEKKLVTAACALVAASAFAVESANIVGYDTAQSIANNNFKAIDFTGIGLNTADIQSIVLEGDAVGYGDTFAIWEGVPTVADGSEFFYWDSAFDPSGEAESCYWGDDTWVPAIYSIAQGQGVVINCGEDVTVKFSGEVPTSAVTFSSIDSNNFSGNPFPAAIDIQNIVLTGAAVGYGDTFAIWEGIPTVTEGSEFFYWDSAFDPDGLATGCYWGNDAWEKATYSIAPGRGFVLNCGEDVTVTINPPYTL